MHTQLLIGQRVQFFAGEEARRDGDLSGGRLTRLLRGAAERNTYEYKCDRCAVEGEPSDRCATPPTASPARLRQLPRAPIA